MPPWTLVWWFADRDGDGFGDPETRLPPAHPDAVEQAGDCDDTRSAVHPGAPEHCDGRDEDCDGVPDGLDPDVLPSEVYHLDLDGDGFGDPRTDAPTCADHVVVDGTDCDDDAGAIHPFAPEICDFVDDDCDGVVDALDDDVVWRWFWADADGDGFGVGEPVSGCVLPPGWAIAGGDCDDGDPARNPWAFEVCNGVDDDCDGLLDGEDEPVRSRTRWDRDQDGWGGTEEAPACTPPPLAVENALDCDDRDPERHPGAAETGDAVDRDCDGAPGL